VWLQARQSPHATPALIERLRKRLVLYPERSAP
jgi:hypothetical protein